MTETNCTYDFSLEHLQALWLQFQQDGAAQCPETGAAISLELIPQSETAEPTVEARCSRCGRAASFEPGPLEGFGWAE